VAELTLLIIFYFSWKENLKKLYYLKKLKNKKSLDMPPGYTTFF